MGFAIDDYVLEGTLDTVSGLRDPIGVHVNNAGTRAIGFADYYSNLVGGYDLSPAYDIVTAVFDSTWKHVSESIPGGVWFDSTGFHMYTAGNQYDRVKHYTLSTAWDQSTEIAYEEFLLFDGNSGIDGLSGKPDGTEIYFATHYSNNIGQLSCPTANSFVGATYVYKDIGFQAKGDVEISLDGTTLYVSQRFPFLVHQFTLSTAWDITTATFDKTHDMGFDVKGMSCSSNGTKMYFCDGTDNIYQYGYTPPNEGSGGFTFTATADAFFPYPIPASVSITGKASGEIKVYDSAYFNFLYEIQTVQAEREFIFLYEIEQVVSPTKIIRRVNI